MLFSDFPIRSCSSEQAERDSAGIVSLEQFALFALQLILLLFEAAEFGLGLILQFANPLSYPILRQRPKFRSKVYPLIKFLYLVRHLVDQQRPLVAVVPFIVPGRADEVRVAVAGSGFGVADNQPGATLSAIYRAFEIMLMHPRPFAVDMAFENLLYFIPCRGVSQRFVFTLTTYLPRIP